MERVAGAIGQGDFFAGSTEQANKRANDISQDRPQERQDCKCHADTAWGHDRLDWRRASRLMQGAKAACLGRAFAALAGRTQIETGAEIVAGRTVG
jgi:hypothetical protein